MDNRTLVERLKWPMVTVEERPFPIAGKPTPIGGATARPVMVDGLARGDMALAAARIELLEAEIAKLRRRCTRDWKCLNPNGCHNPNRCGDNNRCYFDDGRARVGGVLTGSSEHSKAGELRRDILCQTT